MTTSETPAPGSGAAKPSNAKIIPVILAIVAALGAVVFVTKFAGERSEPYVFDGFEGTTWSEDGGPKDTFERVYFAPNGEVRTQVWYGGVEAPTEPSWGDSSVWGSWTGEGSTIHLHRPDASDTTVDDEECDSALTVEGNGLVRVKSSGSCMLGVARELTYDPAPDSLDSLVGP